MLRKDELTRQTIIENLSKGICKVIFRKVTDGRFRSMICTLNSEYVPTKFETGIKQVEQSMQDDVDLLPVFDIVKNNWRSFRIATIHVFYTPEDLVENKEVTSKRKQKEKEQNENSDKRNPTR